MNLPEPQTLTFSSLISDIEKGIVKIPQFQRDFVWDMQKSSELMDSIIKGYPIGTFIFWKTNERLRSVRDVGNLKLPEPSEGDFVNYVLDGQQRLTSMFASLKGLQINRDGIKHDNYSEIFIDLTANEDEQIVSLDNKDKEATSIIRITDLLYGGLSKLAKFPIEYHSKIEEYKRRIEAYNYSIILIKDAPIDIATEIFTRINVGGKSLNLFEIMVAKTYRSANPEKELLHFDLSERYNELIEDLKPLNYETIANITVLQTVAMVLEQDCTKRTILKLNKHKFIEVWDSVIDAIERSVEYFRGSYRIPVSQLLPYNALIIPYAYFFYRHKDKPTGNKQKFLLDFFWRCSLAQRYSSGVEGKLAQDIKKIDLILDDQLPKYDWSIDTSYDFLSQNGYFNAGRAFIKAILCLYTYQQPKSFNDDSIVNISNYWLKQANSRNYHHFFPKAYLKKKDEEDFYINHIANITIVDDFLNKREIQAKAPSTYMKKFKKHNLTLEETMKSHLINDLDSFGIWSNDYDTFYQARLSAISEELKKRIIEQDIDKLKLPVVLEDITEEI